MNAASESSTVDFACSLAGQTVHISREYKLSVTRTGKRLGRQLAKTDCSNKDSCGIARHDGAVATYDWSRCLFLHAAPVQASPSRD
jgi:hypothetical protein